MALTAEQQLRRQFKVTASMLPILMHGDGAALNRLYCEEIGETEREPPTYAMQLGSMIEPFMLDYTQAKTGHAITRRGLVIDHPTIPEFCCTLDGYRSHDDSVLENKFLGSFRHKEEFIPYYYPQNLAQMRCVGASRAILHVGRSTNEPEEFDLTPKPDDPVAAAYEAEMWARVEAFRQCLRTFRPPVPMPKAVTPEFFPHRRSETGAAAQLGRRHVADAADLRGDARGRRAARTVRQGRQGPDSGRRRHRDFGPTPHLARQARLSHDQEERMNQVAVVDTRADLDLAREFAKAKMVPEQYKNSPGDCYIAIKLAQRFKMDPWSVMQEMYLIQGKPMMSGKLATAILNNSLAEPLRPIYAGEGDERAITLTGKPEGDAEPLSVTAKVKDAKTQNEQWKKNPDQMLMYFAARMWGRRYAPDILLGIVFDDEEIPGVKPVKPAERTPIAAPDIGTARVVPGVKNNTSMDKGDIIDQTTGEVLDAPAALAMKPDEKPYDWGKRFVEAFHTSPDIETVDRWLAANADTLAGFEKTAPKVHGNLTKAVSEFKMTLLNNEDGS